MSVPKRLKRWMFVTAAMLLIAAGLIAYAALEARRDPIIRRDQVVLAGLQASLSVALVSDLHVAGPSATVDHLTHIVTAINALQPDLVVIAGDIMGEAAFGGAAYTAEQAARPLGQLRAKFGVVAVLGNHDHWHGAARVRLALQNAKVLVLNNDAVLLGPIAIGGVDDDFTRHADLAGTETRLRTLGAPAILVSHSPDVFPNVTSAVPLVLAGHTHCGQVRLPLIGAVVTMSRYGRRYACGRYDENGRTLIVSAGTGTSILPLRFGAPPEVRLIRLVPPRPATSPSGRL